MAKKNLSNYTKKIKSQRICCIIIDWILLVGPLLVYFIYALIKEGLVVEKVALIGTATVALILTLFNIIAKRHMRSAIWIMIIGLVVAVDNILPLIITIACCTVLDEFVLSPVINKLNIDYRSSLTYDKREAENDGE